VFRTFDDRDNFDGDISRAVYTVRFAGIKGIPHGDTTTTPR